MKNPCGLQYHEEYSLCLAGFTCPGVEKRPGPLFWRWQGIIVVASSGRENGPDVTSARQTSDKYQANSGFTTSRPGILRRGSGRFRTTPVLLNFRARGVFLPASAAASASAGGTRWVLERARMEVDVGENMKQAGANRLRDFIRQHGGI